MIQTIKGIVQDTDTNPVANAVVELQFSYGASQVTGPGVKARTNENGAFILQVSNNAEGVDTVAVTIFDEIVNVFDLDPVEANIDLGTVTAPTSGSGRPRLVEVPGGIQIPDSEARLALNGLSRGTRVLQQDIGHYFTFVGDDVTSEDDWLDETTAFDRKLDKDTSLQPLAVAVNPTYDELLLAQTDVVVVRVGTVAARGLYSYSGRDGAGYVFYNLEGSTDPLLGALSYDTGLTKWVMFAVDGSVLYRSPVTDVGADQERPYGLGAWSRVDGDLPAPGPADDDGSVTALRTVKRLGALLGANDSGGSGFRALVIANA